MPKYHLLVSSKPIEGSDAEYNRWYDEQHLTDVLRIPGIVSAQRFKLFDQADPREANYLAIYDIEAEDIATVLGEISKRAGTELMPMTYALDKHCLKLQVYQPITGRVIATE